MSTQQKAAKAIQRTVLSHDELERMCMRNLLADQAVRVFFKDPESRFLLLSAGFAAALAPGQSLEDLIGKTDFDIFTRPHATAAFADEQQVLLTGQPIVDKVECETYYDRPDAWVSTTKLALLGDDGGIVGTWGYSRDVTAQVTAEKELAHRALHDALTDLPNRALMVDRAEQLLARARREQASVAALYVDLDGFKNVNDTYGHAAGDELLKAVAERLKLTIRQGDTAARLGGDEFVILVESAWLDAGPELVAERLLQVLREPYEVAGRQLRVTSSIGMATGLRASAEELLQDADIALYEAKSAGRNRYVIFREQMHTVAQDRLMLEMDLAEALEREQLFLLYQPIFDLGTGAIAGVEALIRWQHPSRGELAPAEFIPLAERSGLIVSIGRWVLKEACRQAASWNEGGHELTVAVNVAARQLDGDELLDDVERALAESHLSPELLTLEITETALMRDSAASAERLHTLKQLGVRIAIDDFGTGYSSLAYLQQFPADLLKIDRSFIQAIGQSQDSAALIRTLVQLSTSLKLATVAEGIEEPDQLALVRREHCDYGQGFLFSRPITPEALEQLLAESASGASLVPRPH
jgi:diguanylate cyclase (GGDEF)-like protein